MKQIIILLIIGVLAYGYFQYNQPNQEVLDAKKELGIQHASEDSDTKEAKKDIFKEVDSAIKTVGDMTESVVEKVMKKETFEVRNLTDVSLLEFDTFQVADLEDGEIEITGKTLANVDKIRVLYSNKDSEYPDDDFTLKKFNSGDETFLYRAFSRYETFDFGENHYTFYAYAGDEVSKVELTIYYPNPDTTPIEEKTQERESISNERIDTSLLPEGADYGTPIKLGETKVTYSDIKGFELEKQENTLVSCELNHVTKIISEKTSAWSWWNTCRPQDAENFVTYFAVSMLDGKYTYAKHYLSAHYYAIVELETGVDELWENYETIDEKNNWLQKKNSELKEKNEEYQILQITDTLFQEIIQK